MPKNHKTAPDGQVTVAEFKKIYVGIGRLVEKAGTLADGRVSALRGLEVVATAFAAVLDSYAEPNAVNPEGMCDDPERFRRYFADIIINAPRPQREAVN